jgi:hypothetical protein
VQTLDLQKVALAFGFRVPPSVNLSIHATKSKTKSHRAWGGNKKDAEKAKMFREKNLKKGAGNDGRQFSR